MTLTRASLTDTTHCPVCGATLPGPRCTTCGADLSGTNGARLWQLSQQIAALLAERELLVSQLRPNVQSHAGATPATPDLPFPQQPSQQPSPQQHPAPAPAPRRPSVFARLGVHGVLLGIGALMLAVASIVFLVYSWRLMGLPLRATIIATVTAAVLLVAGRMKRTLPDAAEAIGALGVVLVLADAWAVRATGLWGADGVAPFAYTAGACAVCALVLAGWAAVFGVRAGSIGAAVLGPLSLILAGAQIDGPALGDQGFALGLLGASALGLVRPALPSRLDVERRILLISSAGLLGMGVLVAADAAQDGGSYDWATAVLAIAGLLAGVQASADPVTRLRRGWSVTAGVVLAVAAGEAGQAVARSSMPGRFSWIDDPGTSSAALSPWALVPMVLSAAVALMSCVPAVRRGLAARTAVRPGYLVAGAASMAGLLALPAIAQACAGIAETIAIASPAWQVRATAALQDASTGTAITSARGWLTGIGGLVLLAVWTAALDRLGAPKPLRRGLRMTAIGATGGAAVLFAMAPWLPLWATVLVLLLAGVASVLAVPGARAWPVSAVAITIATVLSWASGDLSPAVTMIAAIALLLARRRLQAHLGARAALALAGMLAALIAAQAGGVRAGLDEQEALFILALACAVLVAALITSPRGLLPPHAGRAIWTGADRLAAATPAFVTLLAGCGYWWTAPAGWRAPMLTAALLGVLVLAAICPFATVASWMPALPIAGSGALIPLAGLIAVQTLELWHAGIATCLVLAAVVATAGAGLTLLGLATTLPGPRRLAAEIGTALTGVAALALVSQGGDLDGQLWLVLLLLGVGATAISTAPDRIRLRWLAGLLLAGSSWTRLAASGVTVVEAYTLPPAAVLLALSLLHIRRRPAAAPRLLTQVAAVALGPSILASVSGSPWRPASLLMTAGIMAAGGIALDHRGSQPLSSALARISMLTAAGVALVRVFGNLSELDQAGADRVPLAHLEVWTLPAGVVLLAVGVSLGWVFGVPSPDAQPNGLPDSWYRTGPSLAFLLGPSLLLLLQEGATEAGPARIALLTALGGVTLFLGAVRRLQAPVLAGAAVLLIDGLVHLLPWVAQADLPPWVLLAVVGLSLVILGATYERRLRELRDLRLLIRALN